MAAVETEPRPCDCPENGLTDPAEWCFDHHRDDDGNPWRCTRPAGHSGPHSACTSEEHPAAVWGAEA